MANTKESQLPDNINWEYLKRFKVCAESKNFKEAAQKINTSPHALGSQIDNLEESLGFSLFERVNQNRTSKLTPQGEHVLQLVSIASLYLSGSRPLKGTQIPKGEDKQKIRIVTTPGLASSILPYIIHSFFLRYDNYQFEVDVYGPIPKMQPEDIVIRSDIRDHKDIVKELLCEMSMNLYASKSYIEKRGEPFTLNDLEHHEILAFNTFTYGNTNWALVHHKGIPLSTPLLSNSINFLYEMCIKGHGILEIADIQPISSELVQVLKNIKSPRFPIYVAFNKSIKHNPKFSHFLAFLLNFFEK